MLKIGKLRMLSGFRAEQKLAVPDGFDARKFFFRQKAAQSIF
jgi:hypothetical protein